MELRHLRYFEALAAELSFTRAAEKVHVTQSTLSHQIKQLEQEVGHALFERVGKRVIMTEAGEAFLAYAMRALREVDKGLRHLSDAAAPLTGTLRIGTTHTFNLNLIPTCMATFLAKNPSMRVTVAELYARDVEAELLEGRIDVGIGYDPSNSEHCTFEPLYTEEMAMVVAPDHPLAGRKRIRMAELHGQRLVLATQHTMTRGIIDRALQAAGAEPVVVAEIDSVAAMLGLVRRAGIGAIVSRLAAADAEAVQVIALESPTPLRAPGILTLAAARKSAPLLSFIAIVRRAVPKDR